MAYVRIASRNIPYKMNNKSLPVGILSIPPNEEKLLVLNGEVESLSTEDPWRAIAGEELTVTLKGMKRGVRTVAPQVIRFVPHNPKLSS